MTISVLKQRPNIKRQKNMRIFGGNPLFQATKQHLNSQFNSETVQNEM